MEETGKVVPADPTPATDLKSNPPSPKASPKKLVVRNLSSRLKTRKNSTPYPSKFQGSTKRNPLSLILENNPVPKKIAFEIPISCSAEKNGDVQGGAASSSMDGDAVMEPAPEGIQRSALNMLVPEPVQAVRGAPVDGDEGKSSSLMTVEHHMVQHIQPETPRSNCSVAGGDLGAM